MSRVINTNNPTQIRNQNMRTIGEILRNLSHKQNMDAEAKDMAATIVFALRAIREGVDQTIRAWEKRDYWMKAERFQREWAWTAEMAANFEDVLRHEAWDLLPGLIADIFPHFADMQIKSMTRSPSTWKGAYQKLMAQPPTPLPW